MNDGGMSMPIPTELGPSENVDSNIDVDNVNDDGIMK